MSKTTDPQVTYGEVAAKLRNVLAEIDQLADDARLLNDWLRNLNAKIWFLPAVQRRELYSVWKERGEELGDVFFEFSDWLRDPVGEDDEEEVFGKLPGTFGKPSDAEETPKLP